MRLLAIREKEDWWNFIDCLPLSKNFDCDFQAIEHNISSISLKLTNNFLNTRFIVFINKFEGAKSKSLVVIDHNW